MQEELDNIIKNFPKLLKYQLDHGIIPNSVMEAAGIPPDTDRDGTIVRRDFPITSEVQQRAKTLSHEVQKQERL